MKSLSAIKDFRLHHLKALPCLPILRFLAFYVLLNVPYWVLSQVYFMNRPLFNMELVLPLLIVPFSLRLGQLLLVLLWLTDLIVGMSATFYFNSPAEFVRAAQFLSLLSIQKYITAERLLLAGAFGLIVYALRWDRVSKQASGVAAVMCVGVLFMSDVLNGSSMFSSRATRVADVNIAGSPTAMLLIRTVLQRDDRHLLPLRTGNVASDLVDPVQWAQAHPNGAELFVLVESLGDNIRPEVSAWLRERLLNGDLSSRFDVRQAKIKFNGSTTDGEMRELCAAAGSYRSLTPTIEANCIPQQLSNLGWKTTAMHGFSGAMFRRETWWPEIGFKELIFAPTFLAKGASRCGGAFTGVCDDEVLALALKHTRDPKQFVYVLTLNSHLPLGNPQIPNDLLALCNRIQLSVGECRLTAVLGRVMSAINSDVAGDYKPLPLIMIVGDHAPPFGEQSQRQDYSQTSVPAFALIPR